jgi:trimeric autotransporter adhesin
MNRFTSKAAGTVLVAASALLLSLGVSSASVAAQPVAQATGGQAVTVPAGGTATLQVRGFCLDFGKPFPASSAAPTGPADAKIRAALNYAVQKGYDNSDARQVQEAIWYLATGNWERADHALGTEIANAANDAANVPTDPSGTSLVDALKNQSVTMSTAVNFAAAGGATGADAFYGDATVTLTNSGAQSAQIFLPFGTIFPPANASDQRLVGYVLAAQQAATPSATGAVATATESFATTPGASATVAETGTPAASATSAATTTPVASATAAETATTAATAAATSAATETTAPTAMATETTMPTAMATEATAPAATSTPQSVALPQTGAGSGGFPGWMLLIVAGLGSLLAGAALLRRGSVTS